MHSNERRKFLLHCGKALGGLAMVGLSPEAIFAVRRPDFRLHDEIIWSMGTTVRLSIPRHAYAPRIITGAVTAIRTIDHDLSVHREESELSRLNMATDIWHPASAGLLKVSKAALRFGDLTDGALDVTILPVLRHLGFVPEQANARHAESEVVDYTKLRVEGSSVLLQSGGYAVDFGGIAKGFAVDEAVASLRVSGVETALIDAGGDLFGMGRPESDRPWRIGIRDPFTTDALFATLEIENEAVATSGIYAQTRTVDGVTVSHIIDPATCRPVDHVASATVVAPSTMQADALATAISVLSLDAGVDLIESIPETDALWVLSDKQVAMTTGLRERIHIL